MAKVTANVQVSTGKGRAVAGLWVSPLSCRFTLTWTGRGVVPAVWWTVTLDSLGVASTLRSGRPGLGVPLLWMVSKDVTVYVLLTSLHAPRGRGDFEVVDVFEFLICRPCE